jgi:hypothetical protein
VIVLACAGDHASLSDRFAGATIDKIMQITLGFAQTRQV